MTTRVQDYFSESARRFPDKTAVTCRDERISYQKLDAFGNSFARYLVKSGASRGRFIPFFMPKGIPAIKALLSILKAGCAYVPIDVRSPAARLESILDSLQSDIIVADAESAARLKELLPQREGLKIVDIDAFDPAGEDDGPLEVGTLSIDLAYVLFTSGSTGVPKGVMIPHQAIIDYIDWCVDFYGIDERDQVSNHAPLYFDNSTFDLYTAFKSGATLHLVPDELNSVLPRLIRWIDERAISVFFCVPSVLTLLIRSRRLKPDHFRSLRHLICAGEALPPENIRYLMQHYPHIQYTNMYGPTEITVDCSYHVIRELPDEDQLRIPIGKARPNMELFVRDEAGGLSREPGARGELLVRGLSVSYGYLGDERKTRDSFIQNPLNPLFHDPLYCTGDLVEIDANGDYHFLGRADDQIKYLGYRIELGEIESRLLALEPVRECVVVFDEGDGDARPPEIGALLSLDGADIAWLQQQMKTLLPAYMIPTRLREQEGDFPRTANGKYDRKRIRPLVFGE